MQGPIQVISIHALREEGDHGLGQRQSTCQQFLSTPSARRATVPPAGWVSVQGLFLSTPSARRATPSSAAIRERPFYFYPRPPRGGRHNGFVSAAELNKFLSTPSARRATVHACTEFVDAAISIHALREEGDHPPSDRAPVPQNFYPRPPRGGRHTDSARYASFNVFLSTPSARRATAKTETKSLFSNKLYNILHEFRRALIYNGSKNYPNHAK